MTRSEWILVALTACGGTSDVTPDATTRLDAPTMCEPKTDPLAPGSFKLYLNFDGATLTKGDDNSVMNTSSFIVTSPTTIPMFQPAIDAAIRQGRIDQIVNHVQHAVAPYAIDVVTSRPPSGFYQMFVIGGTSQSIGFGEGILSLAEGNCRPDYNSVALEFDNPGATDYQIANAVLSDLTVMAGMGLTITHDDCANRIEAYDQAQVCAFGSAALTAATRNCGQVPTQDEPALLAGAFGCRN